MKGEKVLFSSKCMEWGTPKELFDDLNSEFHFDLDVAADEHNHKCEKYFTKIQDGLNQEWFGTVFCNPPYGRSIGKWVEKADRYANGGGCAVLLIPSRTDTKWFHEHIYGKHEVRFIKGRLKFEGAKYTAPFPSMVVVFKESRR